MICVPLSHVGAVLIGLAIGDVMLRASQRWLAPALAAWSERRRARR